MFFLRHSSYDKPLMKDLLNIIELLFDRDVQPSAKDKNGNDFENIKQLPRKILYNNCQLQDIGLKVYSICSIILNLFTA